MPRSAEQITTEDLVAFIGGEVEIQNQIEGYLYRGEIAEVKVEGENLVIKFAWSAKNRGGPNDLNPDWDNETNLDYSASLAIYVPSDIGEGRMAFTSFITNETAVLFPADGSKMNPERIQGLPEELKAAQMEKFQQWDATR